MQRDTQSDSAQNQNRSFETLLYSQFLKLKAENRKIEFEAEILLSRDSALAVRRGDSARIGGREGKER